MNAAGAQHDLVTMVHEGGHAVHSFLSRDLTLTAFKSLPSEVAELASMSMELITMDLWSEFYKDENDNIYMTAEQLGKCLGYSSPRLSINNIVTRNKQLQKEEFSVETKLISTDGKSYNTRVFNEDGIYEITFLSLFSFYN
jgi:hypothetical protein